MFSLGKWVDEADSGRVHSGQNWLSQSGSSCTGVKIWKSTSSLLVLIDSCIYFKDVDQRSQTFARAVEMSRLYSRRARTLVLRSAILKANISVKVKGGEKYPITAGFSPFLHFFSARPESSLSTATSTTCPSEKRWEWWRLRMTLNPSCNRHSLWYLLAAPSSLCASVLLPQYQYYFNPG